MYAAPLNSTHEAARTLAAIFAREATGGRRDLGRVEADCFAAMRAMPGATLYECGRVRMVSVTVGDTTFLGTVIVG